MDDKKQTGSMGTNMGASDIAAPPLTPFAAPSASTPSASRSTFHPDVPAARGGMPGGAPGTNGAKDAADTIEPNRLVIGREVKLKGGKISSCDRLSLEGEVEDVDLSKARLLEVSPVGVFRGKADVDEAIIAGRFEGELTAHNRLTIKDGGSISGSVRYGSIVIEPGGSISGEMQTLTEQNAS